MNETYMKNYTSTFPQGAAFEDKPNIALWSVKKRDGHQELFNEEKIRITCTRALQDHENAASLDKLMNEIIKNIFDGISTSDIEKTAIMAAVSFVEEDPAYDIIAARLLLQKMTREILQKSYAPHEKDQSYRHGFIEGIIRGIQLEMLDQRLAEFDLEKLSQALVPARDNLIGYTGMHTLYERYLLKQKNIRLELPQSFWMRIAMGLALDEADKNQRALDFYELLSTLRYIPSTPTLFHAGFPVAQLSSCFLTTVNDDLHHIFKCIGDNAQLSKWAGGIANDWTNIRATGSYIKGIKATSQGVVPYLKIANDVVVAITRSGIRRGGTCVYLETWHLDIEDFLDLKRNTGDERRRTHDMNTANWIPDLFMKRMLADEMWTLFSPHEVPDLHDLYGKAFEERYCWYEQQALEGKIEQYRQISAKELWRKMLTRLFETGHPWITFKDACNVRSPQDHVGVVHSSNLCTEITLNTSAEETAVCNLGSVNLAQHFVNGALDEQLLENTITSAIRMLDNVIDLNFYPTVEARHSNLKHRPIGLGLMGFQDALFKSNIAFSSSAALEFADYCMENISYYAIKASAQLAQERGYYSTYKGSKWDRGIFPFDTIDLLAQERNQPIEVFRKQRKDWDSLKQLVKQHGMRNSNVMAIAPTATISTIAGSYPCIEPIYKNIYVKSNVSGEFTIVNRYLVEDLKQYGLWNKTMLEQLKYHDGDLAKIETIPQQLKEKYKTAFELDPVWLMRITATLGQYVDQSISHNVFMKGVSGKLLHEVYTAAFQYGLKSTYYLRTLGATQVEKATLDAKTYGFTQKREYTSTTTSSSLPQACGIENPSCESCQ